MAKRPVTSVPCKPSVPPVPTAACQKIEPINSSFLAQEDDARNAETTPTHPEL
ncbi:hypothetical protein KSC_025680 [Ktedonobacter sp. SOSP1-52]|nr:hypothetical protein KSC_025680 [Ktedonobacter sp. SOSP1-52]